VHSARYAAARAGESREAQDERNNQKLLSALAGSRNRRAHYYCVIVLLRHAEDPEPLIAEGRWDGEVVAEPRGENGFGYDPYFYLPELDRTAAELEPDVKNGVSHRGQALRELVARLRARAP
jgi:XTP/dITP diphosphohydrolase